MALPGTGYAPDRLPVQPIVVVPGWWVETLGKFSVKAMNAKYLVSFLAKEPQHFTPDQLKTLVLRFEERCRTVEFSD